MGEKNKITVMLQVYHNFNNFNLCGNFQKFAVWKFQKP